MNKKKLTTKNSIIKVLQKNFKKDFIFVFLFIFYKGH
jgi:hypothetical protein